MIYALVILTLWTAWQQWTIWGLRRDVATYDKNLDEWLDMTRAIRLNQERLQQNDEIMLKESREVREMIIREINKP